MENLEPTTTDTPTDPRVGQSKSIALYGIIISLILSGFTVGSLIGTPRSDSLNSSADYSYENEYDNSWVPAGYTAWYKDSNIAWRWANKGSYDCDEYSCLAVDFISRTGCPNGLYADLNWLDSNDNVFAYDSASLPSLYDMQTAKLRFYDRDELGDTGQIASIECR